MSDAVRHVGEWVQIQVCALEVFDSYFLQKWKKHEMFEE